jgi:hypothetical protein
VNVDLKKLLSGTAKLLLLCLVVGYLLSVVDLDPLGLIRWISNNLHNAGEWAAEAVRWAVPYVLLGAVVVVPIYLIRLGLGLLKKR